MAVSCRQIGKQTLTELYQLIYNTCRKEDRNDDDAGNIM